jgi:hypothetical protein
VLLVCTSSADSYFFIFLATSTPELLVRRRDEDDEDERLRVLEIWRVFIFGGRDVAAWWLWAGEEGAKEELYGLVVPDGVVDGRWGEEELVASWA